MAIIKNGVSSYSATCDNCGTPILNIFPMGGKVYGSECIKKMTGQKADPRRMVMIEDWAAHERHQAYLRKLEEEDDLAY